MSLPFPGGLRNQLAPAYVAGIVRGNRHGLHMGVIPVLDDSEREPLLPVVDVGVHHTRVFYVSQVPYLEPSQSFFLEFVRLVVVAYPVAVPPDKADPEAINILARRISCVL